MGDVLRAVLQAAPDRKAEAAMHRERERTWQEEERRRWALEAERAQEQRRAEALLQQAQQWEQTQLLVRLIAAVRENAVQRFGGFPADHPAAEWLRAAGVVVEKLDPIPAIFEARCPD